MTYEPLAEFVDRGMKMSHIYQPVMLIELLEGGGRLKDDAIARKLLAHDQSQIDYYTRITNNMIGRVLRNRGIVERDKSTKEYSLIDFDGLDTTQIEDLVARCKNRLQSYIDARGDKIFQHRRQASGYISGTLRYEIFKRAKFRCELCGISAEEKALEVDHIPPLNPIRPHAQPYFLLRSLASRRFPLRHNARSVQSLCKGLRIDEPSAERKHVRIRPRMAARF